VAQLLVSVRSADEARSALVGGASIIDVKEPDHGSLGQAPWSVWREVDTAVSGTAPISVALGELADWLDPHCPIPPSQAWAGISFCKLGLAGADGNWQTAWRIVRSRIDDQNGPAWIAVIYADWQTARAPDPEFILEVAVGTDRIAGVLVDTWDKTRRIELDERWVARAALVRQSGKLVAMAGGLDCRAIAGLGRIAPDIVAVRGAACVDGNRRSAIDPERVAELARVAGQLDRDHDPTSNRTPCASGISEP
jgi:uncharacterized protein (UPF0264 family)